MTAGGLKRRQGVLDAASQTYFWAYAEDLFRAIFGLELDCGKLWRRKSLGTGVYQPEDPWEVRERLLVRQPEDPWPEDPWEVRERLFRCFRGVSVTAGGLKRG